MAAPFPADTLAEFALATAATDPGRPAVAEPGPDGGITEVSYGQLRQRVDACARALTAHGVAPGDRVLIEGTTCAAAIALLLACGQAGASFIPVGPDTPDLRLAEIVRQTGPALLAQPPGARPRPVAVPTARYGPDGLPSPDGPTRENPPRRGPAVGTDPAYIVFTSGTTGRPKGVVMSHHAALAFYRGALRFGLTGPGDRVASTAPLAFDVSLFDIGVTLGAGATLLAVPREALTFPRRLGGFLAQARASGLHAVPSVLRPLLRYEPDLLAGLTGLRSAMVTGEDFPLPELRELQRLRPDLRLVNAFGATETVAFSFAEVPSPLPDGATRLPIGCGYPGGEMFLLDQAGQPVTEPGQVGEIYVRGPSAFSGYFGDPEATRRVLVPDPLDPHTGQLVYRSGDLACRGEDGSLYFTGRADAMVKIRGNRIEPGEIERRLREHPAVTEAAVVPVTDGTELSLAAFTVLAPGLAAEPAELAGWCQRALPAYMIPQQIRTLGALPLTSGGKLDRQTLARLAERTASCPT